MFEIALVVIVVLAAAGSRAVSGSRRAAWTTLGAALVWPFVNRSIEGPVLVVFGKGHGLTVSDLLTPLAALLAVSILIVMRRRLPRATLTETS